MRKQSIKGRVDVPHFGIMMQDQLRFVLDIAAALKVTILLSSPSMTRSLHVIPIPKQETSCDIFQTSKMIHLSLSAVKTEVLTTMLEKVCALDGKHVTN